MVVQRVVVLARSRYRVNIRVQTSWFPATEVLSVSDHRLWDDITKNVPF